MRSRSPSANSGRSSGRYSRSDRERSFGSDEIINSRLKYQNGNSYQRRNGNIGHSNYTPSSGRDRESKGKSYYNGDRAHTTDVKMSDFLNSEFEDWESGSAANTIGSNELDLKPDKNSRSPSPIRSHSVQTMALSSPQGRHRSPSQIHSRHSRSPLRIHQPKRVRSPSATECIVKSSGRNRSPSPIRPRRVRSPPIRPGRVRSPSPIRPNRTRSPSPIRPSRVRSSSIRPSRVRSPSPIRLRRVLSPSANDIPHRPRRISSPSPRTPRKHRSTDFQDDPGTTYNTSEENWDEGTQVNVKMNGNYTLGFPIALLPGKTGFDEYSLYSDSHKCNPPEAIATPLGVGVDSSLNSQLANCDTEKLRAPAAPVLQPEVSGTPITEFKTKIKTEKIDDDDTHKTNGPCASTHQPKPEVPEPGEVSPSPPPPPAPSLSSKPPRSSKSRKLSSVVSVPPRKRLRRRRRSLTPEEIKPRTVRHRTRSKERKVNRNRREPTPPRKHSNRKRERRQSPDEGPRREKKTFSTGIGRKPYEKPAKRDGTNKFDMNIETDRCLKIILPPPPPIPQSIPQAVYQVPIPQLSPQQTNALYNMASFGIGPLGLLPHQIATLLPHQLAALAQLIPLQAQLQAQAQQLGFSLQLPQVQIPNPALVPLPAVVAQSSLPLPDGHSARYSDKSSLSTTEHPSNERRHISSGSERRQEYEKRGYSISVSKVHKAQVPRRVSTSKFNGDDENWDLPAPASASRSSSHHGQGTGISVKNTSGPIDLSGTGIVRKDTVVFDYGHGNGFSY